MKAKHEFYSNLKGYKGHRIRDEQNYLEYLRHYYAGLALQGLLANPIHAGQLKVNDFWVDTDILTDMAIESADKLLQKLENSSKNQQP